MAGGVFEGTFSLNLIMNSQITNDNFQIREFEERDREAIGEMVKELQEFERLIEADRLDEDEVLEMYTERILDTVLKEGGKIWIAEAKDEVVGFVFVEVVRNEEELLTSLKEYGYVSDLFVTETFRNKGLATALLKKVEGWAREKGLKMMKVESLASNMAAVGLYRKVGFREYEVVLVKEVK